MHGGFDENDIFDLFEENVEDHYIKSDVLLTLLTETEGTEKLDRDEAQEFIKENEVEGKGVPEGVAFGLIRMIVPQNL